MQDVCTLIRIYKHSKRQGLLCVFTEQMKDVIVVKDYSEISSPFLMNTLMLMITLSDLKILKTLRAIIETIFEKK